MPRRCYRPACPRQLLRLGLLLLLSYGLAGPASAEGLAWQSFEAGLAQTRSQTHNQTPGQERLLLLQAHQAGCEGCEQMEQDLLKDPELARLLHQHLVPARIDTHSQQRLRFQGQEFSEEAFARKLQVVGTPTLILFSPEGRQLGRIIGYQPPQVVQGFLTRLLNKYRQAKL